ncbi:AAA family ATPase [Photobacterium sp. BZF1]|nr:AAA family ATPase [Photobacterium sp. BZF1]
MNPLVHSDQFRVTSVRYESKDLVIFAGTPLLKGSHLVKSARYCIAVKTHPNDLPVKPVKGQHWSVTGARKQSTIELGDYQIDEHLYDKPDDLQCNLEITGEDFIQFIASDKQFRGIGVCKARALWTEFGKELYSLLDHDCRASRERLQGVLSVDAINGLYEGYKKYENLSACNWMSKHQIPSPIQQRLLRYHNKGSIKAIQENPYRLLGFGMPFTAVDKLAQGKFAIATDDPRRLSAALGSCIHAETDKGHTYTTQDALRPKLKRLLKDNELVSQAFRTGYEKEQYVLNPKTGTYHPTAQLFMEKVIAQRLLTLASQSNLFDEVANNAYIQAAAELPYELLARQQEAVLESLDNGVACITGGAGTGKTTVLRTALRAFLALGYEIHAVALSGRAAKRMNESIGMKTKTIAALLKGEMIVPTAEKPRHLLVIDEASMLDIPTTYRIVTHLHPSVRILLTGDPDQLPPIGCGKVLSDIVESATITNTTLDIVKRQDGATGIPEYSKSVNAGQVPENLTTGAITFHETPRQQIAQRCTELFQEAPETTRVMGPTRDLVRVINSQTQTVVNPDGKPLQFELQGELFYRNLCQGDAILFTKNLYDKDIQNGSLGVLESVEGAGESLGTVRLDTDEVVEITPTVLDCMELGYVITLHKAQGSQFPRIIVALQFGRITDRAWLYTAITRAEAEIHIVGSAEDFRRITEAPSNAHRRNSYLATLLKDDNA